jgi:hypothetical protein
MCDSIACNNLPIYLQNVTLDYDPTVITPYYTTVGLLPSNQSTKRVWNFSAAFVRNKLAPNTPLTIVYDFSKVQFEGTASFESPIFGSLSTKSRLYNAGTYINYTYDEVTKLVTFVVQLPCQTSQFSYQFEIFDSMLQ